MGALRGIGLVIVCVLFFVGILAMNSMLTVANSLEYENVQGELKEVIRQVLDEDENIDNFINKDFSKLERHCLNNTEFVFNYEDSKKESVIPCEIIDEGSEAVIEYQINSFAEEIYYKEYNCEFWDCLDSSEEGMFVVVSEKAHDYWKGKFYLALLISLVLFVLIFLLVEKKSNSFILAGALLIASSLPFIKLENILSVFSGSFLQFLTVFVSQSYYVFLKILIFGIIVLAVGIVWKFFKIGFWIQEKVTNWRNKKEIVREKS